MARFRRKRMNKRGSMRGFFRSKAKRRSGRSSGSGIKLFQLDAMIYGAARAPISNLIAKYVPIPVLGGIGDEVAMGAINYLVAKNMSGIFRDVAMKGLVIENARVGEAIVGMTGITTAITGQTGSNSYVYG